MRKFLIIVVCLATMTGYCQLIPMSNKLPNGYNFWINIPDGYKSDGEAFPIFIFLHGKSLRGNDLERVKKYGVIKEIVGDRKIPAIVVAPQCPLGQYWTNEKVLQVLEYVKENYNTDTNRIYLTGMSMGGGGTLRFAGKYASKITAAIALCGSGFVADACTLNTIPLWIMHGREDRKTSFAYSEKMVAAIRQCGGKLLKFTAFDHLGHDELVQCFGFDELYEWLFSYSKAAPCDTLKDNITMLESEFRLWHKPAGKRITFQTIPAGSKTYVVKNGDTLSAIAKKYQTTVSAICRQNAITSTSKLKIGQVIILP